MLPGRALVSDLPEPRSSKAWRAAFLVPGGAAEDRHANDAGVSLRRPVAGSALKQSRFMSLVESAANVAVGYGVAVMTQILIFPIFGLQTTLAQNLQMGAIFSVVSIGRSFILRRLFEAVRVRSVQ